jgi:hypothetical protein
MALKPFRCPRGYSRRLYETALEEVEPISLRTVKYVAEVAMFQGLAILLSLAPLETTNPWFA